MRNTRANKMFLRRQLYNCINGVLELGELVAKIDLLCSRLQFLEVTIGEQEKLAVLLSGARKQFESIVVIIEMSAGLEELKYSEVVEK
jgi:hypothetical protein